MYSDKVKSENIDMDLLGISNMYQVEALQVVCENHLSEELDPENVFEAWMGAHLLRREIFLEVCEDFIISNWDSVQRTDSFKKSLRENPDVVANLMIKIFNCVQPSSKKAQKMK